MRCVCESDDGKELEKCREYFSSVMTKSAYLAISTQSQP